MNQKIMGDYTQYFIIIYNELTYKEQEYVKMDIKNIYGYITESLCCTPETKQYKSTILQKDKL